MTTSREIREHLSDVCEHAALAYVESLEATIASQAAEIERLRSNEWFVRLSSANAELRGEIAALKAVLSEHEAEVLALRGQIDCAKEECPRHDLCWNRGRR
jgi:chromosome segregation ATPase